MTGPLTGADGDLGEPTINIKTLTVDPLGGARADDLGAPTINAKKYQRWTP
jgi:hypothetical protein